MDDSILAVQTTATERMAVGDPALGCHTARCASPASTLAVVIASRLAGDGRVQAVLSINYVDRDVAG
ncbi:MAG: hypothetical protein AAFP90_23935, partial [Planctomycetota bacterium]